MQTDVGHKSKFVRSRPEVSRGLVPVWAGLGLLAASYVARHRPM
jgi:hypothetical protein